MHTVDSGTNPSSMTGSAVRPRSERSTRKVWRRSALALSCLIAAVCILLLIISYSRHSLANIPVAEAQAEPAAGGNSAAVSIAAEQSQWRYSVERDAAGQPRRVGCVDSGGVVFLGEPYNSEHASLCLRSDGMAYLKLDGDGRITSGAGHDAGVQVGQGPVEKIATLKAGDQSRGVAILSPAAALFAAARSGKPITVTATYDDDVKQALTFAPQEPLRLDD